MQTIKMFRVSTHPSVMLLLRLASGQARLENVAKTRLALSVQKTLWDLVPASAPDYIHPVLLERLSPDEQAKVGIERLYPSSDCLHASFTADELEWLKGAVDRFREQQPGSSAAVLFADADKALEVATEYEAGLSTAPKA